MKNLTGCLIFLIVLVNIFVLSGLVYFLAPVRTNILILGIDGGLGRGELGRADTIILATVNPLKPYVGMLSIPRDLWVPIEGVGENRINTAYFYAEVETPGTGPDAARKVVSQNFHVGVDYYFILRMDGLLQFIDSMGGVDIIIDSDTVGLKAGKHHLNGEQALQFARSRANSDDFSRMAQGQILIKAVLNRVLQPDIWSKLPNIIKSNQSIANWNVPYWMMPRLAFAILRSGQENIDARTITRDMVRPFVTDLGAQVLEPDWDSIRIVVKEMFGE
jgi:polyisoprenyl-teichoic acid--peptidoglycan teichoic acid transferase